MRELKDSITFVGPNDNHFNKSYYILNIIETHDCVLSTITSFIVLEDDYITLQEVREEFKKKIIIKTGKNTKIIDKLLEISPDYYSDSIYSIALKKSNQIFY